MKYGTRCVSAHQRSTLSLNNLYRGHQFSHSENPPRRVSGPWDTTYRTSHMPAKNISVWFTEISNMLHVQVIFRWNNVKSGLLTVCCEMVAFGACTVCLLLREWSRLYLTGWKSVVSSKLMLFNTSSAIGSLFTYLRTRQVALQRCLCYSRSQDIFDQTPAARWAKIKQDEYHSNLPLSIMELQAYLQDHPSGVLSAIHLLFGSCDHRPQPQIYSGPRADSSGLLT